MANSIIEVKHELRPCEISGKFGLFHGFYKDGSAVVELPNGEIVMVYPTRIRFLDSESRFNEYCFRDDE